MLINSVTLTAKLTAEPRENREHWWTPVDITAPDKKRRAAQEAARQERSKLQKRDHLIVSTKHYVAPTIANPLHTQQQKALDYLNLTETHLPHTPTIEYCS